MFAAAAADHFVGRVEGRRGHRACQGKSEVGAFCSSLAYGGLALPATMAGNLSERANAPLYLDEAPYSNTAPFQRGFSPYLVYRAAHGFPCCR